MNISSLMISGLFLVLLSAKTEAKPLAQSQQDPTHLLGEEFIENISSEERGHITNVVPRIRSSRGLNLEIKPKRSLGWRNNSRKSSKKKGCFGLKIDKIGAMSKLGC